MIGLEMGTTLKCARIKLDHMHKLETFQEN